MDIVDKATRSKIMSKIGQKNTGPEIKLRRSLHSFGLRYRLHDRKLPGSPDIVLPRFKTVIFVHGCFWHRHGCKASTTPGTNIEFWQSKFEANVERDRKNTNALLDAGWRVVVVWECALRKKEADLESVSKIIMDWLKHELPTLTIPHSLDHRDSPNR